MPATSSLLSRTSWQVGQSVDIAQYSRIWTNVRDYLEIYRIVSSKALDQGEGGQNPLGERRQVVEISKTQDTETKQGCC